MANPCFRFKQFTVYQQRCALKVCTDACLFGAWTAEALPPSFSGPLLDVGTGTGLLSLMLAQATASPVDAVEIDPGAAEQAAANFAASPWSERFRLYHTDFLQFKEGQRYALVISNPPFYEGSLRSKDAGKNTAKHDSTLTLEPLLEKAAALLAPGGRLALLLPGYRMQEALDKAAAMNWFPEKQAEVQTHAHKPAFRCMLLLGRNPVTCSRENIIIHDHDGGYTKRFSQLLQPYYLYL